MKSYIQKHGSVDKEIYKDHTGGYYVVIQKRGSYRAFKNIFTNKVCIAHHSKFQRV